LKTILLILLIPAQLLAQVVFSEILYNEPGNATSLEWIEIYNRADSAVNLSNFIIVAGFDTTFYENTGTIPTIPARQYAVLTRKLLSSDGTPSFEGHWGDSSGFWGDCTRENYPAFNANFSLPNSAGTVYLLAVNHELLDECVWNTDAGDAQSLERDEVDPPSGSWHFSTDTLGSTPGRANSPRAEDEPESVIISTGLISQRKGERLEVNYSIPDGGFITLEIFNDSGHKEATLVDKSTGSGLAIWNGAADDGGKLTPGVYLLLTTISGTKSKIKTIPVVLAP
jgi:hypothetical protein